MKYTDERVYEILKNNTECLNHRITRFNLAAFALGYFGYITNQIMNAIERLYLEGVVDA